MYTLKDDTIRLVLIQGNVNTRMLEATSCTRNIFRKESRRSYINVVTRDIQN